MTADMSVAPEIARLAEPVLFVPPPTLGTLARRLRIIAATPEQWWGLVRFEPDQAVEIPIETRTGYRAWLMVLPPGHPGQPCDCDAATMIAGEAVEGTDGGAGTGISTGPLLRPGSLRVHGQRHRLRGRGTGYSISLHARTHPAHPAQATTQDSHPAQPPR